MLGLNAEQRVGVTYLDGPLLVLAGAGSGKTRVITQKIAYLVTEQGLAPKHIVAVTFTNKAAREMKQRIARLVDEPVARALRVSTFHTFGLKFIRRECKALDLSPKLSIFDTEDSVHLLQELSAQTDEASQDDLLRYLQCISLWKNQGFLPDDVPQQALNAFEQRALTLYHPYQKHLQQYQAVDFDDLILLPLRLLQSNSDIKEKWQNGIRYLLVDEYQDTNLAQYQLIRCLTGVRGQLTVVGDDHQSVYAWRGARPENLLQLQADFPTLKVVKLEQNYRSTGNILQAANQLIQQNASPFEKKLWSRLGSGDLIRVVVAKDEEDEANRVALHLLKHKFEFRTEFQHYAILYRSNHQSRLLEKSLREHRIPYQISGGTSFFARTEIKDILAYCRLLVNPDDDRAFLRIANIPKREIGPATLQKLAGYAKERGVSLMEASFEIGLSYVLPERSLEKLRHFTQWITWVADNIQRGDAVRVIQDMVKTLRYETWLHEICTTAKTAEKRMENVSELLQWLERLMAPEHEEPKSFHEAIQSILLVDILERNAEEKACDAVQLMTLHAAKGLEFPHVTIIGMEEDILPHKASIEAECIEEERRLAYVGLTRAQKTLTLSLCEQRKRYQEILTCVPSRFLGELPQEILTWERCPSTLSVEEKTHQGKTHLANMRALLNRAPS